MAEIVNGHSVNAPGVDQFANRLGKLVPEIHRIRVLDAHSGKVAPGSQKLKVFLDRTSVRVQYFHGGMMQNISCFPRPGFRLDRLEILVRRAAEAESQRSGIGMPVQAERLIPRTEPKRLPPNAGFGLPEDQLSILRSWEQEKPPAKPLPVQPTPATRRSRRREKASFLKNALAHLGHENPEQVQPAPQPDPQETGKEFLSPADDGKSEEAIREKLIRAWQMPYLDKEQRDAYAFLLSKFPSPEVSRHVVYNAGSLLERQFGKSRGRTLLDGLINEGLVEKGGRYPHGFEYVMYRRQFERYETTIPLERLFPPRAPTPQELAVARPRDCTAVVTLGPALASHYRQVLELSPEGVNDRFVVRGLTALLRAILGIEQGSAASIYTQLKNRGLIATLETGRYGMGDVLVFINPIQVREKPDRPPLSANHAGSPKTPTVAVAQRASALEELIIEERESLRALGWDPEFLPDGTIKALRRI